MKPPKTYLEAEELLRSGDLRHQLKLRLILLAYGDDNKPVSLKAVLELLLMPDERPVDWTDELTVDELLLGHEYVESLKQDLLDSFDITKD